MDARTELLKKIDDRLAEIEAAKQAKIDTATAEAEAEIKSLSDRLDSLPSMLPRIQQEPPVVPPMPTEAGDV